MIRLDLEAAREKWLSSVQDARQRAEREGTDFLVYRNHAGLVADFHALRHTYISRIVRIGASAKTAQTLAKHSSVSLTLGRYAHAARFDLTAAVEALPSLLPKGPDAEAHARAATGTDGEVKKTLA